MNLSLIEKRYHITQGQQSKHYTAIDDGFPAYE